MEVHCNENYLTQEPTVSGSNNISRLPELTFDRLQLNDEELYKGQKRPFGRYVARGAVLDEEYWTAAWLRAEAQWEAVSYMRHVDSYKRKYAEQEFYSLKRRCSSRDGNSLKCSCIVAVKKEDPKIKRSVLNSVVGTLDISIRQLMRGESFPGESQRTSNILVCHETCYAHLYGYVANVCVSKFARRQGIATNMMYLATDIAISSGMKQLFVHVNLDNSVAQELYRKVGFKIVDISIPVCKDQRLLMKIDL